MTDLLLTWEEISEYLRMSRRTAQRMERDERLPIRRKGKGYVYALRDEVDAWLTEPAQTTQATKQTVYTE